MRGRTFRLKLFSEWQGFFTQNRQKYAINLHGFRY